MKFEIDQKHADILKTCISKHTAANKTMQEALKFHSVVMEENQLVSDEMWRIFEQDFELDMTLDWLFTEIANVPYIVSQKHTAVPANADNQS